MTEEVIGIFLGAEIWAPFSSARPCAEVFVTLPSRKKRVEVSQRKMTSNDAELFREAKSKLWNAWVEADAVQAFARAGIPCGRIITIRLVLTVK